ncbi:MAG: bis(5'-nucleosyl)-tetraphosphatase (symmetrical) YqeK [Elusimicrobiales bacterium]
MTKILVYGGCFDPPHRGHGGLLTAALTQVKPDLCIMVPAFVSPFKDGSAAEFIHRKKLAAALIPAGDRVAIDDFEFLRGKKTYTYQLLRALGKRHSGAEFYLLMGSDCFAGFSRWRNWREICGRAKIVVGQRKDLPDIRALRPACGYMPLKGAFPAVSSTALRAGIYCSGEIPADVPARAAEYIRRHGLYGLDIHRQLKAALKPGRYEHTRCTAALATRLAERHGVPADAAALAGLLHDAGKRDIPWMLRYCRKYGVLKNTLLRETALRQPGMLHSHISADVARRSFGVRDADILSAIENHTLGRAGMSLLEKIVFVSDAASEDRGFGHAGRLRALALRDIDAALLETARIKLAWVIKTGKWLCPKGIELWNSLTGGASAKF